MINLLPTSQKNAIIYARRNSKLLKASFALMAVTIGVLLILASGHFFIANATTKYEDRVKQTRTALDSQDLESTKKRIADLSNGLNLILKVLSREILFSKLLKQAGAVMPEGSVLSTIEISQLKGGIDLVANAKSYGSATQIQLNLQDPRNKLFEKVDIVSVSCGGSTTTDSKYPCTVTLRALFNDNNPYLFINSKSGSKTQ